MTALQPRRGGVGLSHRGSRMFGHIYCHSERHGFTRFRLVFSVSGDADGDDDTPFAFISNGSIIVSDANADAMLQIVDMTGHIIVSADVARNISTNGMAQGVYVLRLIKGDEVKTQRIVIE